MLRLYFEYHYTGETQWPRSCDPYYHLAKNSEQRIVLNDQFNTMKEKNLKLQVNHNL
jgi:hypothetical protein